MFAHAGTLPWDVWLAGVQLLAFVFWRPLTKARSWLLQRDEREDKREIVEHDRLTAEIRRLMARISELEDLIDLLRKALDKHLIRESAVEAMAELLIMGLEHLLTLVDDPQPAVLRTLERARDLLAFARGQLQQINNGVQA